MARDLWSNLLFHVLFALLLMNSIAAVEETKTAPAPQPSEQELNKLASLNPFLDTALKYKPNDTFIDMWDKTIPMNDTIDKSIQRYTPKYWQAWFPSGIAGTKYTKLMFKPGQLQGKGIFICHVDEMDRRAIGITWVQGRRNKASTFKKCVFAFANPDNGYKVEMGEKSGYIAGWSILQDNMVNERSQYKWSPVNRVTKQCHQLQQTTSRPPNTICPRVTGNYAEVRSRLGFNPNRMICRWVEGSDTYIGYTDARRDGSNRIVDPECYSWKWTAGWNSQRVAHVRTSKYKVLVHRDQNVVAQTNLPASITCGPKCRATPGYPRDAWPGIAGNDIVEGTMFYAQDVASCCAACRSTPGCKGYAYDVKGQRWCWLKYTNCFQQCFPPPPQPNIKQCSSNSFPVAEQYAAMLTTSDQAKFSTGTCSADVRDGWDTGYCGLAHAVRKTSMAACCKACQSFNVLKRRARDSQRCYGWTYYKGYNTCFLRDKPDCVGGWEVKGTAVSGWLRSGALYG